MSLNGAMIHGMIVSIQGTRNSRPTPEFTNKTQRIEYAGEAVGIHQLSLIVLRIDISDKQMSDIIL